MVPHPETPEKAGAANEIASLQEDLYYSVRWHNASLLGGASWVRFLALSSSASGAGSYAERWCLCTTFRYGIKLVQGSPACTFSWAPQHPLSLPSEEELSSPCQGSCSALYVLPTAHLCWDSQFSFPGDSFEQINGESFSCLWETKKYHLMSHTLQWEEI